MRLKQLYIKGFKSFANETIINFEEDVIGIVGPNGSGKSNIVDALRWVLGEQKGKELRLESMSDVIFNGSKKRKKSKVATVSVTFENTKNLLPTEYNIVTISRLLYQNGDSEYRLNDVPCRLKDITALLVDTGIGSNSYAIIALGMVDDILANKDNARRKMFEQAAGILKYKTRKKQTLQKLNSTNADLERVQDLLSEIEKNLKALEKQAKRTEKYYKIKNEYKELSIKYAVISTSDYLEQSKDLRNKIQEENDLSSGQQVSIAKTEAEIQAKRSALLEYEESLSVQQKSLNELTDGIRSKENTKIAKKQELDFLNKEINGLQHRNTSNQQTVERINEGLIKVRELLSQSNNEKEGIEQRLQILEQKKQETEAINKTARTDLDGVVALKSEKERKRFTIEKQIAVYESELSSLHQDLNRRKAEIDRSQEFSEEIKIKTTTLLANIESCVAKRDQFIAQIAEEKNNLSAMNLKRDELQEELQGEKRRLDAKSNEYELLKSMVEKMEGSPESIKYLAKQKEWDTAPLLSDVLLVDDPYRTCLENYLDKYLNHYVVPNADHALKAINLLTKSQRGKAKFFILDRLKDTQPSKDKIAGCSLAVDKIEVDAKYTVLLNALLHNVYIVEKDETLSIVEKYPTHSFITQDGRMMGKGAELSGGSVGLFEGKKIGRKKQLEKLKTEINKIDVNKNKLEIGLNEIIAKIKMVPLDDLNQSLNLCQRELHQLEQDRVGLDVHQSNLSQQFDAFNILTKEVEEKDLAIEKVTGELNSELSELNTQLELLDRQLTDSDESYQELILRLNTLQNEYNAEHIKFIQFQNKVSEWQKEIDFNTKRVSEIDQELASSHDVIGENEEKIRTIKSQLAGLEEDLVTRYQEKEKEGELLNHKEKSYYTSREDIRELEDQLRKVNKTFNQSQLLINTLKEKYNGIKLELSSVQERLRVEFNVELDEVDLEESEQSVDLKELMDRVHKFRNRIQNFGEINPMAIEAYQEIEERYITIKSQRDDIVEAKESLLKTIQEIEETATTKYMEAFEQVRLHFIEAFRSLFTEDDNCDMLLVDPDNPLESDIEIVAKPKGKRPKSLSQLSGGEKTLTATALLFALYLLKPAPFCIFDEVDAPLDDANIEKFNGIIKRFSKDSQFVIVTHNKQTMAAVDVIYGVYMEELGVSNLSQVDFRNYQHIGLLETV